MWYLTKQCEIHKNVRSLCNQLKQNFICTCTYYQMSWTNKIGLSSSLKMYLLTLKAGFFLKLLSRAPKANMLRTPPYPARKTGVNIVRFGQRICLRHYKKECLLWWKLIKVATSKAHIYIKLWRKKRLKRVPETKIGAQQFIPCPGSGSYHVDHLNHRSIFPRKVANTNVLKLLPSKAYMP